MFSQFVGALGYLLLGIRYMQLDLMQYSRSVTTVNAGSETD